MKPIPVFYDDRQVFNACSFSKSPLKPGLLVRRIALDEAFEIHNGFDPISVDQIKLTHDHAHIDALMNGDVANGFGNRSTKEMVAVRYTVGNLLAAARHSDDVVWSLTSGFHHAHADGCGGFCTIEGLTLVAAITGMRTLIVDEDAHYGDGCVAQIARNRMSDHCTYLQSGYTHNPSHVDLKAYRAQLEKVIERDRPELILYQAGADNWVCDPLGGCLTMAEMYQRDIFTLDLAKRHGIKIVVNLAGGYAEKYEDTLQIHMNTGEAMKEVFHGYGAAVIPGYVMDMEEA